ncbi:MAG: peptidoglycan-binding domain-containing protein [Rhodothermales bacterium]|nr:peptidoglycan-binding domain-containing protein [Rhodothermales bacterium]
MRYTPFRDREYVRWIQSALNDVLDRNLPVDGVMTRSVRAAVRAFQRRESLPADGIIGPDTEKALIGARTRPDG